MTHPLKLAVLQANREIEEVLLDQPLEVGRQRAGEPGPFKVQGRRLIITHETDGAFFSRKHLTLEPLASGLVRVGNHSPKFPLEHDRPGSPLPANGGQADLTPPFRLLFQHVQLQVSLEEPVSPDGLNSLDQSTRAPGSHPSSPARVLLKRPLLSPAQLQGLASWLQNFTALLQSSLASTNLYDHAAQAVVQLGLTTGCVLLRQGEGWAVRARHGMLPTVPGWAPSSQVLERMCQQPPRTFFHVLAGPAPEDSPSVAGLEAAVAAPLLDRDGNVLGALYGERIRGTSPGPATGNLEAALVELLACAVAAGLERDQLMRAQVQFEQFFGEQLARELQKEPGMLQGREAEVTLLFCDVRGFSTHCQELTPAQVTEWMNDVLSELSACVLQEDGVLVDYIGDELIAMWGAPRPSPTRRSVESGPAWPCSTRPCPGSTNAGARCSASRWRSASV